MMDPITDIEIVMFNSYFGFAFQVEMYEPIASTSKAAAVPKIEPKEEIKTERMETDHEENATGGLKVKPVNI